jgi:NAD(P)-dependent dehydrogenase (short-subunit alcohol dehydrogenase family)
MAKSTLADLIEWQKKPVGSVVKTDLSGKTVLITGANSGLGFEAAKHFASMNPARLIIVCRNQEKGEVTSKGMDFPRVYCSALATLILAIKDSTGCQNIEIGIMEQGGFSSVVAFADKFEREGRKIDILVANAGVSHSQYSTTEDGWEMTRVL